MSVMAPGGGPAEASARGGARPQDAARREAAEIRRAAQQFEALMLQQVFKEMQRAAAVGGERGLARDIYQGQFAQHVADQAAASGGIGLADALAKAWGAGEWEAQGEGAEWVEELRGWQMPVAGRQTSGWGERVHPVTGRESFHHGLDIAAAAGTSVRPTAAGRVVEAGERGDYGLMVEIEHANGWTTRYAHLRGIEVEEGDWVSGADVIGAVGSTGKSTGPHLHLEFRKGGRSFSPEQLLVREAERSKVILKGRPERDDVGHVNPRQRFEE